MCCYVLSFFLGFLLCYGPEGGGGGVMRRRPQSGSDGERGGLDDGGPMEAHFYSGERAMNGGVRSFMFSDYLCAVDELTDPFSYFLLAGSTVKSLDSSFPIGRCTS